jgi:putative drug exporter of the RND superfamily
MAMLLDSLRSMVSRRPGWVVGFWVAVAAGVGLLAPDLTRLAAEGQAKPLGRDAESSRAAEVVSHAWPEQAYESLAVAALHRPGGLNPADLDYARRLAERLGATNHPQPVLRVLGPSSPPEVADRLVSRDRTVQLIVVPLSTSFVVPTTSETVSWLQAQTRTEGMTPPSGLEVLWTGDAVIGRDYMGNVQTSLDRAAIATVFLLLIVLLVVYRSFWLPLIPLTTIGICLMISRGLLAWMARAGWEISPMVELFLVALLFGTGTDFCLFISWRYGEHWNPHNPGGAMRVTLKRTFVALMTSAGTVIVGLLLMGTTRFKLFSSTGPSVALGLALTLSATMTLTPALLVLLARLRPRAFAGFMAPSSGYWDRFARKALERPAVSWGVTVVVLAPLAVLGTRTRFVQDLVTEMPVQTPSTRALRLLGTKFEPGMFAPLTVVLESDTDLRQSEGLALIDDASRFLAHQRRLLEVRSATQPLGSPKPLEPARIASRLGAVNDGFEQMADGARVLQNGLIEGAVKLRATLWLEHSTGLNLIAPTLFDPKEPNPAARAALATGLKNVSLALFGNGVSSRVGETRARTHADLTSAGKPEDPRDVMLHELNRAAEGAALIADGARRARHEVASILRDPVGRKTLDHLLITPETVREHPELLKSFSAYITPDGHRARIDLTQSGRVFSSEAMDQVVTLRRRLAEYLDDLEGPRVRATITGPNAESADIRSLTHSDQFQSWFVIPIGVFLVLIVALRDPLACLNLVATMLLTYVFALGTTHLVFVTILGAEGIDWKVPYFLFVLLVAVGVDYNVFLMDRVRQESERKGLRSGIMAAVAQTGGLISSAAAITACSFASFLVSPLGSLRQLGFALVIGITVDALIVRPLLVPCGHWLLHRRRETKRASLPARPAHIHLVGVAD